MAEFENLIIKNITFIDEQLIPQDILIKTEYLLKDIDSNDTVFVALTKHLGATLWTGDLKLYNGLKAIQFNNIVLTPELSLLIDELEK